MATIIEVRATPPSASLYDDVLSFGQDGTGYYVEVDLATAVSDLYTGYFVTFYATNTPVDGPNSIGPLEIISHVYDGSSNFFYVNYDVVTAFAALLETLKGNTPGGYSIPVDWKFGVAIAQQRKLLLIAGAFHTAEPNGVRHMLFSQNGEMRLPNLEFAHYTNSIKDQLGRFVEDGYATVSEVNTITNNAIALTADQVRSYVG